MDFYSEACGIFLDQGFNLGKLHMPQSNQVHAPKLLSLGPGIKPIEGMAADSSILAWRIPMDWGAWWAMVPGIAELDTTEWLSPAQGSKPCTCIGWWLLNPGPPGSPEPRVFCLFVVKLFILYQAITDEQTVWDGFRWTVKGLSRSYTCIHFPHIPFRLGCPTVEQSSKTHGLLTEITPRVLP